MVKELKTTSDNFDLFLKGNLNFMDMAEVILLFEFCLQLNHESQSSDSLNDKLKPLFNNRKSIRLVETTPLIAKYIGYLMKCSKGLSIQALQIFRISLDSHFALESCVANFPGIESFMSSSISKNLKNFENEESSKSEGVKSMRDKIQNLLLKSIDIPTDLLMMIPANVFNSLFETLDATNVTERRKIRQGLLEYLLPGIKVCTLTELEITGLKEENANDWYNLFINMSQRPTLQKLSLINVGLEKLQMPRLLSTLSLQNNLIHLDLSGNDIGNAFVEWLVDNRLKHLQALILQETGMTSQSLERLGKLLVHFPALQILDIRLNDEMDDTAVSEVINNLRYCLKLERLMIPLYNVTEKEIEVLNSINLPFLRTLKLTDTRFPQKVIQCLLNIIPRMNTMEELWITSKYNEIEGESTLDTCRAISPDIVGQFADVISRHRAIRVMKMLFIKFDTESFLLFWEECIESETVGLREFW